ncbi:MAG: leucine-rich repeat domain-containing protein, partial [Bacteroidales bacterium]|nr:leucine-rich repeat domain-containing protein [Bacteroidales bacterium]
MRKIYLKLSILIISLLAVVAAGRVFIPDIFAAAATSGPDVDLSEYYVFKVNPKQIYSVTYKTKSQSGMRPQTYDADGYRWYMIPSSEAPTSFTVTCMESSGVVYGIKSIKDETGKTYTSAARGSVVYATNVSPGKTLTVESDVLDKILTSTFVIEVVDDPAPITVALLSSSYNKVYTASDFTNKKLEVKYDPNSESDWVIVRNDGTKIGVGLLDGVKQSRLYVAVPGVTSTTTLSPGFSIKLDKSQNQHKMVVYSDLPKINVPVRFEFEQTTGNETDPDRLTDMIQSVKVGSTTYTNKEWLQPGFTVPNGSYFVATIKTQVYGYWEFDSAWFNGEKLSYSGSYCDVETHDPNDVQIYKISGKLSNPFRYTLDIPNLDQVGVKISGSEINITESPCKRESGTKNAPTLQLYGKEGYKVDAVVVDGQTIPLEDNTYTPKKMDEVVKITAREYKRDIPVKINATLKGLSKLPIYLDPKGQKRKVVNLVNGDNTVNVHPEDLPFSFAYNCYVAVNGDYMGQVNSGVTPSYLSNLTADDEIKVFNEKPYELSMKYDESVLSNAKVYHDNRQITAAGTYSVLSGTVVKVVPNKSGWVIENYYDKNVYTPGADGAIKITPVSSYSLWMHPANSTFTVNCPQNWQGIRVVLQDDSYYSRIDLDGPTTEITLPYSTDASKTYTYRFISNDGVYSVTNVTASPSTGFKYDVSKRQATGIKANMTLTLTSEIVDAGGEYDYYIWFEPPVGAYQNKDLVYYETARLVDIDGYPYMVMPPINIGYIDPDSYDGTSMYPCAWTKLDYLTSDEKLYQKHFPVTVNYRDIYQVQSYNSDQGFGYVTGLLSPFYINICGEVVTFQKDGGDQTIEITEPQNFIVRSSNNYDDIRNCSMRFETDGTPFFYSINKRAAKSASKTITEEVFGCSVEVWSDEDVTYTYYNAKDKTTSTVTPNSEGKVVIEIPEDYKYTDIYKISVAAAPYNLSFTTVAPDGYNKALKVYYGETAYDSAGTGASIEVPKTSSLVIKTVDADLEITEVRDKSTGESLPFDRETGEVSNLKSGMKLEVVAEVYDRSNTFTVFLDGTDAVSKAQLVLDPGGKHEKAVNLTSGKETVINYAYSDLPFGVNITYSSANTSPVFIIDNEMYQATGGKYDIPVFPSGTYVRIYKNTSRGRVNNVTYNIEEGIGVTPLQDGTPVTDLSQTQKIVTGGVITFEEDPENIWGYEILKNGSKIDNDAETVVGTTDLTFEANKTYNDITIQGNVDFSNLTVYDNLGNLYEVSSTQKTVKVPSRASELFIIYSDDDSYITSASCSPSTMKFDANNGAVSGITTGSVTINTKKIERNEEVSIFVDGSDFSGSGLDGAYFSLANGKTIETGQNVTAGNQTLQFGEDDLPIIFKLPEGYTETGSGKMPVVHVNGESIEYSAEKGGYVFPESAFTDPKNPPVIRIYAAEPDPVEIGFLVEPGITFKAVADGDESTAVKEAATLALLPGAEVTLTATADKAGEEIFIEIDGNTITEGHQVSYDFIVGSNEQTIEIKRKKVALTLNNEDAWRNIRVNGAGFTYPMYSAQSELEFPVGTTQLTLRSTADDTMITSVLNNGVAMNYDKVSGVLNGVADKMNLTIVTGPMTRDNKLTIYLEESEAAPAVSAVLAKDKAVEKEVKLKNGYQQVNYADSDLPFEFLGDNVSVYVNNELVSSFPSTLPANSVVKVYGSEQPKVNVSYDVDAVAFKAEVMHDHAVVIDHTAAYSLLPGTEITFSIDYLNPETAKLVAARRAAARAAAAAGRAFSKENTEVSVNGEALVPQDDDTFLFKVLAEHASEGLKFVVKRPDYVDETTGLTLSGDRKTVLKVSPDAPSPVVIPEGVTAIGEGAFKGCDKITAVELPESLEKIGKDAFEGTSISSLVVPDKVTSIGEGAFKGCSGLKTVVLGKGLEEVGEGAFEGCNGLGKSMYPETLGKSPFPETVPAVPYNTEDELEVDKNGYITTVEKDEKGNVIGKKLVFVPTTAGTDGDENGTFTLPDGITSIGAGAFAGCDKITKVVVPETSELKTIGKGAFEGCDKLTEVDLSASKNLTEIGEGAFKGTSITDITLPETLEKIGGEAFEGTKITSVVVPDNVKEIGEGAFKGCSELETVKVGKNVETIGGGSFEGCEKLTEVDLSENKTLTEIGEGAFKGTSITEITLPETLEKIGGGAFEGTDLKTVVVPDNVKEIGGGAFKGCSELKTVVLGNGLEEVGENAFEGCDGLGKSMYPDTLKKSPFPDTVPAVPYNPEDELEVDENGYITTAEKDEQGNVIGKKLVFVPTTAGTDGEGNGKFTLPDGITSIGAGAFAGCDKLTDIDLTQNKTLKEIGEGAFKGTSITEITLPETLEKIGGGAFEGTKITSVVVPDSVKEIGEGAFKGCDELETVKVGKNVETIGGGSFEGCNKLTEVDLSETENLKEIGEGAFKGSSITDIELPETLEKIGGGAFEGTKITSVVVPDNVKEIGEGAFKGCDELETVVLGNGLDPEKVGKDLFEGSENLSKVVVPDTVKEVIGETLPDGTKEIVYNHEEEVEILDNGMVVSKGKDAEGNETKTLVSVPVDTTDEDLEFPEGLTSIGGGAFAGCDKITEVKVPDTVKEIGEGAFKGTSLTTITLPDSLEKIGGGAFEGTDLTTVVVPDNVKEIGEGAFKGCSELKTVVLGNGLEEVGENAFEGCDGLGKSLYPETLGKSPFPDTVPAVPYDPEDELEIDENGYITAAEKDEEGNVIGKKLVLVPTTAGNGEDGEEKGTFTLPDGITSIGEGAFAGCDNITKVVVPDTSDLKTIGKGAFEGCDKLTEVDLSESKNLKEIGEGAFKGTSITDITLPDSLEKIGGGAFEGTDLKTVVVPDNVKEIGEGAFKNCKELETAVLGNGLDPENVGKDLFEGNDNLERVVVPDNLTEVVGENLPDGTKEVEYKKGEELELLENGMIVSKGKDEEGNETKTLVSVPEKTTDEDLEFPDGLTSIGKGAFEGCKELTEVKLPDTVTEVGEGAFKGCEKVTEITLPDGLKEIGEGAFTGCKELENVEIPETVEKVGEGLFE